MINCIAYDVEALPNFFSITFISLNDYLKVFKDCRDSNDKAIPLVQKLSVAEIKDRLSKVKTWQFYITDTDDTQLIPLIGFINNLRIRKEDNVIIRNDLYGFNSGSAVHDNKTDTTASSTNSSGFSNTGANDREIRKHGNIGVVTNADMISSDISVWRLNNFYDILCSDVCKEIALSIF